MAKCRECNGQGSDFDPSDFSSKTCRTCDGTGEVSDSPQSYSFGALPPDHLRWQIDRSAEEIATIAQVISCRKHLLTLTDDQSKVLVTDINILLKWLGVE